MRAWLTELPDVDENPPKTRIVKIAVKHPDYPEGYAYVEAASVRGLPNWLAITTPLAQDRTKTGRVPPGSWRVTHLPSGLLVLSGLSKTDAILAARAVAREAPVIGNIGDDQTKVDWSRDPYRSAHDAVYEIREMMRRKEDDLATQNVDRIVQLIQHGLLTRKELMKLSAGTQVAIDDVLEQAPARENPPRGDKAQAVEASLRKAGLVQVGGGSRNTYYGLPGQKVGVGYFVKLSPKKLQYVLRVRGQYGKKLEDIKRESIFYGHIRPSAIWTADGDVGDELGQTVRADLESHAEGTQAQQTFDSQAQALLNEWRKRARVWDGSDLEDLAVHYKSVKRGYGVQETFDKALLLAAQGTLDPRRLETYYAVENVLEDMVRL